MLIDVSYFISGPRHIENASVSRTISPNSIAVNNAIEKYICSYQEQFLDEILGTDLACKLSEYLNYDSDNQDDGYDKICSKIRESFADYVFFYMLRDINHQATITGFVQLKCANTYTSPIARQVSVWNDMVCKNKLFLNFSKTDSCPFVINIDSNMLTPINSLNL